MGNNINDRPRVVGILLAEPESEAEDCTYSVGPIAVRDDLEAGVALSDLQTRGLAGYRVEIAEGLGHPRRLIEAHTDVVTVLS